MPILTNINKRIRKNKLILFLFLISLITIPQTEIFSHGKSELALGELVIFSTIAFPWAIGSIVFGVAQSSDSKNQRGEYGCTIAGASIGFLPGANQKFNKKKLGKSLT